MTRKTSKTLFASIAALLPFFVSAETNTPASSPSIHYAGRHVVDNDSVTVGYPGVEVIVAFSGSKIAIAGEILGSSSHYNVSVDDMALPRLDLDTGPFSLVIANGLAADKTHTLRLVRRSEAWIGLTRFDSFSTSEKGEFLTVSKKPKHKLLSIGDSITCGEKADLFISYMEVGPKAWNAERSYGWYLAKDFDAETNIVSYGGKGLIRDWQGKSDSVTAPQFFERSLPDAANQQWDHSSYAPDLVTICLGTNDFSRGIPDRDAFVPAYIEFVKRIHEVHPKAKVLLVSGPWFAEGDPKKEALNSYISETIAAVNAGGANYAHHHFFTTTYPGTPRDAHPIAPQHRAMADDIGKTIKAWLGW